MLLDQKHLFFGHTKKNSRKGDRKGGGVKPYDWPDRKISVFFDDFAEEGREESQFASSNESDYQNSCLISLSSSKMNPLFLYVYRLENVQFSRIVEFT